MRSFFNVDSTVTTRRLVEGRKNYFIPPEYELHVPLQGERPYDTFPVLWVEYSCDPRVVHGLLLAKLRASWVLLGRSQRILCERCAF
ncbi:hypothetical protein BHE74_00044862 [Ensete ventricosum]|nr:hypothetical protein BHE74_00044862 [Ensete ventricosum]